MNIRRCEKCGTELIAYPKGERLFDVKCIDCGYEEKNIKLLFPILLPEGILVTGKEIVWDEAPVV